VRIASASCSTDPLFKADPNLESFLFTRNFPVKKCALKAGMKVLLRH
jgi:hypothetical protein